MFLEEEPSPIFQEGYRVSGGMGEEDEEGTVPQTQVTPDFVLHVLPVYYYTIFLKKIFGRFFFLNSEGYILYINI